MPTVNDMRSYISNRYPGMDWKAKVSKMKPAQVIAIFKSIKERDRKKKKKPQQTEPYHQIDMFEYLYSINAGKETHTEVKV